MARNGGFEGLSTALQTAFGDLYHNPELVDKLCADPHRIADFVDDPLRLESPFPTLVWHTTAATTVAGVLIPAG
ncbi:hypothetical protein [Mycolicibacterium pallens]|uniref:Cytochrome P450 n=1 Tax=Mycolicibacterium pallens TaxID=370524 RepID=A0ABX8VU03_9MYCO|nr:hypothetical protein [Mycolicibacterium pallens]QYL19161.1 cytochrome P450 [Mycolicibacterium pallens]